MPASDSPLRIVMAQLGSVSDKRANYEKAAAAVERSATRYQAQMVVFPEIFMSYFPVGTPIETIVEDAETLEGPFTAQLRELASRFRTWLVFGMKEKLPNRSDRVYNTVVVVSDDGEVAGVYRKTHLYDAFGFRESDSIEPGPVLFDPIDTPFGKLGVFVCYELRFPEIARYQALRGADIIVVPSGWVRGPMKEFHWTNLVTTRALENTLYVVACNQASDFYTGQSLIVDPMGVQLVTGPESEALIPCEIDLGRIASVRKTLPSHRHRRTELYT
ncbi:carbon-nitrogen hydrolase family protein [Cohnella algarum]|uniref:carbon-nitrogen hydrolase family protein n=1 Tax=Cohnella algarum TaxID=2044859 RepID=UPI0019679351|nr:carbon-nitrogen hydrolase family protein [Cohnella algarum]MBN2984423.1 carbon-nitrogen hydrolase family protein [Cohnella algarum]